MENLTLIQSERIDFIQKELQEIKSLIQKSKQAEIQKQWLPKNEAKKRLNVCLKTLDNYLSKGILPYSRFAGKIYIGYFSHTDPQIGDIDPLLSFGSKNEKT